MALSSASISPLPLMWQEPSCYPSRNKLERPISRSMMDIIIMKCKALLFSRESNLISYDSSKKKKKNEKKPALFWYVISYLI